MKSDKSFISERFLDEKLIFRPTKIKNFRPTTNKDKSFDQGKITYLLLVEISTKKN